MIKSNMQQTLINLLFTLLTACSLAPTYQPPLMPIPDHYKEAGKWLATTANTLTNQPKPWWEVFRDPVLNQLEEQVSIANQDLKVAFARYQEACASARIARSALVPTIQGLFNTDRQKTSRTVANPTTAPVYNEYLTAAELTYELDVWGRIRNTVVTNQRLAQASAFDLAAVSLSLHAQLASDYFTLRADEDIQRVLDKTVKAYQKALFLTQQRYKGGASPIADVYEAQTQLENAKTMAADIRLNRAQLEHAIATLIGEIPANFNLAKSNMVRYTPPIAPNLPSTLLERRPDIAAAQARVMAANANIGVARAAFFPAFNLTAIGGFDSRTLAHLFSIPSLLWSLGPTTLLSLSQPVASVTLFDGGRLRGLLARAHASYFEAVANYRQTVLTAFQDVEDSLVAIYRLDQEKRSQLAATNAAKQALIQAQDRYKGGIVTFLDVVIFENTCLQAEINLITIRNRRQLASVQLIKALGGMF